jgi:hypothetical protein
MSLRSQLSAMRRAARPTLARRSPLKLSTIRQTGVISGELHKAFKLIRQQMHSRIRSEFGSAHSLGQSDRNNRDMPTAPCTPSRHTAPKYTINSANRGRTGPNPYRFNSATSSIRIWSGTHRNHHTFARRTRFNSATSSIRIRTGTAKTALVHFADSLAKWSFV